MKTQNVETKDAVLGFEAAFENIGKGTHLQSSLHLPEQKLCFPAKLPSLREIVQRISAIPLRAIAGAGIRDKAKLFLVASIESNPISRKAFPNTQNLYNLTIRVGISKFRVKDKVSVGVLDSSYEAANMKKLSLKRGDVFIDVGAHVGKYTVEAAREVGDEGRVISVEPFPSNIAMLKENIGLNRLKNVEIVNMAAWNCSEQLRLFVGDSSAVGGIYNNFNLNSILVKAEKMDRIVGDAKLGRVDWVKIDVEGAEYQVLQGIEETLERFKPRLLVEVWQRNKSKVEKLLSEHNYVMNRVSEECEFRNGSYADYLCTPMNQCCVY